MSDRTYTARPFVYQGLRWDRFTRKASDCVQPLEEATLAPHGEPMMFKPGKRKLVIGGIYTGAEFDENGARGLNAARYYGRWKNESDRLEWQALDSQADANAASAREEANERRRDEIEAMVLPLRKLLHSDAYKFDPGKQQAIINAVTRALRVPPRAGE